MVELTVPRPLSLLAVALGLIAGKTASMFWNPPAHFRGDSD